MNKIKQLFFSRALYFELLVMIVISLICLAIGTVLITVSNAEKSYIASYADSNELILERTAIEYENLTSSITNMLTLLKDSQVIKTYLTQVDTMAEKYDQILKMRHFLDDKSSLIYDGINYNLVLIGKNENSYYKNSANLYTIDELITKNFVKDMTQHANKINRFFLKSGLITLTQDQPIHLFGTAILDENNENVLGYAMIEITEDAFSSLYKNIIDAQVNTIMLIDANQKIISSNAPALIGTMHNQNDFTKQFIQQEMDIPTLNAQLISSLDKDALGSQMLVWPPVLIILGVIILIISIILSIYLGNVLKPIYTLIKFTSQITKGNFNVPIESTGTKEIKELIQSFNYMQQGLNTYVAQLIQSETEKKEVEMEALQLQIKPHFIYNTLTSIKFLIMKNQNELASETIEAFSNLLQYSIYNGREMITLEEEINLSNQFVKILQSRYGDRIQFISMIPETFHVIQLPKLVLQPFIENAFIHAFPNDLAGTIMVDASEEQDLLKIEIIDTGIGYLQSQTDSEKSFSGIGIHNINQRLTLIYQTNYHLTIEHYDDIGTIVTLKIPMQFRKAEE